MLTNTVLNAIEHAAIALFPNWEALPARMRNDVRDRLAHVLHWGRRISELEAALARRNTDTGEPTAHDPTAARRGG